MRTESLMAVFFLFAACGAEPTSEGPQGAAGLPGAASLVRLDDEPPNAHCPSGGVAVQSGVDENDDGELQDDEITSTRYVCHGVGESGAEGASGPAGADGRAALVRLDEESAGENCAFGGTRVSAGVDVDGNGMLDAHEVESIEFVCNGADAAAAGESFALRGDYVVDSLASLLVFKSVGELEGALTIRLEATGPVSFPNLVRVGGGVSVEGAGQSLSLPALEEVGGAFVVANMPDLESIALGSLRHALAIDVSAAGKLAVFDAPVLEEVPEHVVFKNNDALQRVSMTRVASTRYFTVEANPALSLLSTPALTIVFEGKVVDNPLLAQCALDALLDRLLASHSPPAMFDMTGNDENAVCE